MESPTKTCTLGPLVASQGEVNVLPEENMMHNQNIRSRSGFSIMPLPVFLVVAVVVGWVIHSYTGSLLFAFVGGIISFPVLIWILDLVFNSPLALRCQNYPGNHLCPGCNQKYDEYRSMPSSDKTIILECFKCGEINRFDTKYNHIEKVEAPNQE